MLVRRWHAAVRAVVVGTVQLNSACVDNSGAVLACCGAKAVLAAPGARHRGHRLGWHHDLRLPFPSHHHLDGHKYECGHRCDEGGAALGPAVSGRPGCSGLSASTGSFTRQPAVSPYQTFFLALPFRTASAPAPPFALLASELFTAHVILFLAVLWAWVVCSECAASKGWVCNTG